MSYCDNDNCTDRDCVEEPRLASPVAPQRPPKMALPAGMTRATYEFQAETAEDLGRRVDEFIDDLDFNQVELSAGYSVCFELTHARSYQAGVIRTHAGPFYTELSISRREP